MISNKKKKQLLKKKRATAPKQESGYIAKLQNYRELFNDYPDVKFLINNVIEADHLVGAGLLPQELPQLILPNDIQDRIFKDIDAKFDKGDPKGDKLWNQFSDALPDLDKMLRSFRDYLEETYGMWAYISAPFVKSLAEFIGDNSVLEIMAGNGYISKGLKGLGVNVYPTDNLAWTSENQTGKHQTIPVEKLDALAAIDKYQSQVNYIIMSWSPDKDPIDYQVLQAIRKADNDQLKLIVIGEKNGATNSKKFWEAANYTDSAEIAKINDHHKPFDLIKDQVYLVH
ncbi:SAM-dependent methyltransferase [Lentilactobacillus sp. Marseille-Q4993]|uniref:SAM-dependent methyltransferase n=1 Tax=Lentilactobacillus sp. Marseille-Q4993 TaxID=3039492 RepID=UPI0024BD4C8C|nr:SAM-dependent methyltransferase [Lentilactobacillus sp. Marseille-Q4993]